MKKIERAALVLVVLWVVAFFVPKYLALFAIPQHVPLDDLRLLKPITWVSAGGQNPYQKGTLKSLPK